MQYRIAASACVVFTALAPVHAASFTFEVEITEIIGGGPSQGFNSVMPIGGQVIVDVDVVEGLPLGAFSPLTADLDILPSLVPGGGDVIIDNAGSIDLDPDATGGTLSLTGFVAGFTVSEAVKGGLIVDSGSSFALSFSVDPASAPALPLVSSDDIIAFLEGGGISVAGLASINFFDPLTDDFLFNQQVVFSTPDSEVPLPAAGLLFVPALAFLKRRQRSHPR